MHAVVTSVTTCEAGPLGNRKEYDVVVLSYKRHTYAARAKARCGLQPGDRVEVRVVGGLTSSGIPRHLELE